LAYTTAIRNTQGLYSIAVHNDGSIVAGGIDGKLYFLTNDGALRFAITRSHAITGAPANRPNKTPVYDLAVTTGGATISSGDDGSLRVWNAAGGLIDVPPISGRRFWITARPNNEFYVYTETEILKMRFQSAPTVPKPNADTNGTLPREAGRDSYESVESHVQQFIDKWLLHLNNAHQESDLASYKERLEAIYAVWQNANENIKLLIKNRPSIVPNLFGGEVKVSQAESSANPWASRVFITTQSTRFGLLVLLLYLVQIFLSNYRYNSRVASFYWARHNACRVAIEKGLNVEDLATISDTFSPDSVDFSRVGTNNNPGQQMVQLFSRLTGGQ
jgi:hypothetical protein